MWVVLKNTVRIYAETPDGEYDLVAGQLCSSIEEVIRFLKSYLKEGMVVHVYGMPLTYSTLEYRMPKIHWMYVD